MGSFTDLRPSRPYLPVSRLLSVTIELQVSLVLNTALSVRKAAVTQVGSPTPKA